MMIGPVLSLLLFWCMCPHGVCAFCCNYGKTQETSGKSCAEIIRQAPDCKGESGFYWIENKQGTAVQVYCNMERRGGGWERVAYYDSKQANAVCPGDMVGYNLGPHHLCTNNGTNITKAHYLPVVQRYSEVMGLMVGFASGDGDAFRPSGVSVQDLDGVYMEGLSLCINDSTGFVKHVFSVGVSSTADLQQATNCFLYSGGIASPPHVVGKDYLCCLLLNLQYMSLDGTYSATTDSFGDRDTGACAFVSTACRSPGRYFIKQLARDYTNSDSSLIVRVISQGTTVIAMSFIDIYVR